MTPGTRWNDLRTELYRAARTEQELGDDYGEMPGEESEARANRHWGRAEALREVMAMMDRAGEQPEMAAEETGR